MEFLLTPHTKLILSGNGVTKQGRGMKLVCAAPVCVMDQKGEGRDIHLRGYVECKRCGYKEPFSDWYGEWVDIDQKKGVYRKNVANCKQCTKAMKITFTQIVVSKHRKSNHYYYHKECYEAMFFGADGEGEGFIPKPYKTRYAGAHGGGCQVILPFDPRKGVCSACGKSKAKGEITMTSMHHWRYAYKPDTVRKNPILALENTSEFCFSCHRVADALRNLLSAVGATRVANVVVLMPDEMKEKLRTLIYVLKGEQV